MQYNSHSISASVSLPIGHALADRSVSRCGCHAVSSWEDRCVCFLGLGRGGVDCGPRRQLRDYPNLKPNRTELRIQLFFPQHGRCAPIPTPKWWIGVHLGFCFLLSNAFDPGVKSSSVTQMQRTQTMKWYRLAADSTDGSSPLSFLCDTPNPNPVPNLKAIPVHSLPS